MADPGINFPYAGTQYSGMTPEEYQFAWMSFDRQQAALQAISDAGYNSVEEAVAVVVLGVVLPPTPPALPTRPPIVSDAPIVAG